MLDMSGKPAIIEALASSLFRPRRFASPRAAGVFYIPRKASPRAARFLIYPAKLSASGGFFIIDDVTMNDLDSYLRTCEAAVRAAGEIVQDWIGRAEVRHKGHADLVTQADLAAQAEVRRIVLGAFPDHGLLGEEAIASELPSPLPTPLSPLPFAQPSPPAPLPKGEGSNVAPLPQAGEGRKEYRWIVDPLDGTTNYVHGVPHYCVSLALERGGELLVGAVYDPTRDECFTAASGRGAFLNGKPIHPSGVESLSDALASVGFPPQADMNSPDLRMFMAMLPHCQAIRRTGSSALNLCYIAAGRFDLYWAYSTHVWDIAAGTLILQEAGGRITAPDGGQFRLEPPHFLAAATPELHAQMLEVARREKIGL
jgi:myo-inositol-1(or 4)-monophosphatase